MVALHSSASLHSLGMTFPTGDRFQVMPVWVSTCTETQNKSNVTFYSDRWLLTAKNSHKMHHHTFNSPAVCPLVVGRYIQYNADASWLETQKLQLFSLPQAAHISPLTRTGPFYPPELRSRLHKSNLNRKVMLMGEHYSHMPTRTHRRQLHRSSHQCRTWSGSPAGRWIHASPAARPDLDNNKNHGTVRTILGVKCALFWPSSVKMSSNGFLRSLEWPLQH